MGCCSSSGSCGCPVQPCPTRYASCLPRLAFGLVLVGYGVNHYRNLTDFVAMSQGAFPAVPSVGAIAGALAYVVPALMIVGGLLFAIKQFTCIAKVCILAALAGIIGWAGLAVLLGDGSAGTTFMQPIQNASILLILYYIIKKMSCCGSKCAPTCACGKDGSCVCGSKQK